VFAVTANGKIQAIDADYLHTEFWTRLTSLSIPDQHRQGF
jgi:hypothetical protein